ncbi:MAG: peptide chain release factor-like protein [Candidatus Tritonobacter lacicola]|nr:peptide chain release factor-like protein [Candidatus Tritonobacter lacicola]
MNFPVTNKKREDLLEKMRKLGIREEDILEKFVRSSGRGGQKVNKTSTCVYLKHLPTGVEVKMQRERSQALNRFLARRLLADKIERIIFKKRSAEEQRRAKIRRQKRRRSRRAKEKMLVEKKKRSIKKMMRARPTVDE